MSRCDIAELRAAVAGTGFIGPVHVQGLRGAGIEVVGIVGSTPEKSRQTAERLGVGTAFASYDELLNDDRVRVVHVTTPNRLHFDMAARALAAGKHVMCEKPLAMTSRESAELVRRAAESGLAAAVTYNIRFYPLCHEARERVRGGQVGHVFHVSGSYVQDWLLRETDFNWRVLAAEGGALRALADIGTHWLDLLQFVVGRRVTAVCADLATVHRTRQAPLGSVETFGSAGASPAPTRAVAIDTDDCGAVMLRFENGAVGVLWVSQVTAGRKNCLRFEIAGSSESLAWNSERPDELWIGHRDRPNEVLLRDPALLSPSARAISNYPGGHNEGFPDTFKQCFRVFYDLIAAGECADSTGFPTFADGHYELLLCEAILLSHRERRWVEVHEVHP
ncbi:MAG: Gfo/Idh/MocA family protein [Planctomycetaceae bacterium]